MDTDQMASQPGAPLCPVHGDDCRATRLADLTRPFATVFSDTRGGQTFDYFTGEQARTRLLDVFGPGGCESRVLREQLNAEANEVCVLVELAVRVVEHDPNDPELYIVRTVVHQEWGSQKMKRSRSTGEPLDLGFDLKGATTDGLKKCCSDLGIGLYLWRKLVGGRPAIPDEGLPEGAVAAGTNASGSDRERSNGATTRQNTGQRSGPTRTAPERTTPSPASPEEIERYEVLRAEAVVAGFKAPFLDEEPSRWTSPQLAGFTRQLDAFTTRQQRGAA
jgi:hypothetical protein